MNVTGPTNLEQLIEALHLWTNSYSCWSGLLPESDEPCWHSAPASEDDLATMAADPDIQQELRRIEEEFRGTELDGLE